MNTELEKVFEYLSDASQRLSAGELEPAFAQLIKASSLLDACIASERQSASSKLQRPGTVVDLTEEHRIPSAQAALAMAG